MTGTVWAAIVAGGLLAGMSRAAPGQVQNLKMQGGSISFKVGDAAMKVAAVGEDTIHVQVARDAAFFARPSFAVLPGALAVPAKSSSGITGGGFTVNAGKVSARIDARTMGLTFMDVTGRVLLAEVVGGRMMEPAEVQGEKTFHVRQQWNADGDEALYGLGQHQFGLVNLKGYDIDLWQHNTEIAVPFLLSSKGYGILWDNNSFTKFGDPREFAALPPDHVSGAAGNSGGFTRTSFSDAAMTTQTGQRVDPAINNSGGGGRRGGNQETAVRWEGQVQADVAGVYQFRLYANGGYKMWIDDRLVADHWRQGWLAWDDIAKAEFAAGSKHKINVDWIKDGGTTCTLTWKPPPPPAEAGNTSLSSQVGEGIDYYFIYGGPGPGALDRVIAGYRFLTGQAPMMPIWAFGLWQSRQRYETQQASIDVVKGFRDRRIPFDNIVQDWMYWRQDDWGSHQFDPQRFPNPDLWIKDIHALNARLMISVWGKFYPTTDNYKALAEKGYMYPVYPARDWMGRGYPYAFYDTFSAGAREMFWRQVNERLFAKGVDAWWMDATEPDVVQPSPPTLERMQAGMPRTAAGPGPAVMNAYPLLNSQAVYEGQRKAAPEQRVFILTRSGYAGQQRYAAASWSGDISATWTAMRKQIAAGLGYSISGLPYWTMDCGGFSVPGKFNNRNAPAEVVDEWREMNARWFEFATFVPLLRVHGEAPFREMWQFGGESSEAYKAMFKFDRLRYQLLPYIYSLAGEVTHHGGTIMRPLVMDFPDDMQGGRDINDQYMFGRAFMVSPVTAYKSRSRQVWLPHGTWYDFWTGKLAEGFSEMMPFANPGSLLNAPAPYDQIPLHVRAGSIIPFGPDLQYTTEKKADPLTLWVYSGADGAFTLYEDDGLTYQYEKGAYATIPIKWDNAARTLTIGARVGQFNGMLNERTIQVVFVSNDKPVGFTFEPKPDRVVKYTGAAIEVKP